MTHVALEILVLTRHADSNPNRVRLLVRTLRGKSGDDAANPAYLLNERGVGYRMPAPGDL